MILFLNEEDPEDVVVVELLLTTTTVSFLEHRRLTEAHNLTSRLCVCVW